MGIEKVRGLLPIETKVLNSCQVAMIGAGAMGGGMTLLMAENGISVSIQDPSTKTVDALIKSAEEQGIHNKLAKYENYKDLSRFRTEQLEIQLLKECTSILIKEILLSIVVMRSGRIHRDDKGSWLPKGCIILDVVSVVGIKLRGEDRPCALVVRKLRWIS
jgi:hypothetical protein